MNDLYLLPRTKEPKLEPPTAMVVIKVPVEVDAAMVELFESAKRNRLTKATDIGEYYGERLSRDPLVIRAVSLQKSGEAA